MKVSYGIMRGSGRNRKQENKVMDFPEYTEDAWHDDAKVKDIQNRIRTANPGKALMGWAIQWIPKYVFDDIDFEYWLSSRADGPKHIAVFGNLDNGFCLHKHGTVLNVYKYVIEFYEKLEKAPKEDQKLLLSDLVFMAGRIPLNDINKMISTTGYGEDVIINQIFPDKLLIHLSECFDVIAFKQQVYKSLYAGEVL